MAEESFSALKIVVSEEPLLGCDDDCTVISPAFFRHLVQTGSAIEFDEFYVDIDSVPYDLLVYVVLCIPSECLFAYSRRFEMQSCARAQHAGLFSELSVEEVSDGMLRKLRLVFLNSLGCQLERAALYHAQVYAPGHYGCRQFLPRSVERQLVEHAFERRPFPASSAESQDRQESVHEQAESKSTTTSVVISQSASACSVVRS